MGKVSKSGDTISGNLAIMKTEPYLALVNTVNDQVTHDVRFAINKSTNDIVLYDATANKIIIQQSTTGNTLFDGIDLKSFCSKFTGLIASGRVSGDGSGDWVKNSFNFTLTKRTIVLIDEQYDLSGVLGLAVTDSNAISVWASYAMIETSTPSAKQLIAVLRAGTYIVWSKNVAADGAKTNPISVYGIIEV